MNFDVFTVIITAGKPRVIQRITGDFIRIIAADEDFNVQFDGAPAVPLGVARAVRPRNADGTPQQFQELAFIRTGAVASNTIQFIVGVLDYEDNRTALYANQSVKDQQATSMQTRDMNTNGTGIWEGVTNGVGGLTVKRINVRNLSAVDAVRIASSTDGAETGKYLGPGEEDEFEGGLGALVVKSTAVVPLVIARFFW